MCSCRGANIVILNWQRPLWEGKQEAVKRSGRDEPMCIAIHKCMEATLGISLYSYLYLKPAKTLFLFMSYVFSSTKSENKRAEQVLLPGSRVGWSKQCIHKQYM
jgi:hypothetical protein